RVRDRVYRVSERILHRGEVEGQVVVVHDYIRRGDRHVLLERAVPVDPEDGDVLADVGVPGPALVTAAAGNVALRAHVISLPEAGDPGPQFLAVSGDLTPQDALPPDSRGL